MFLLALPIEIFFNNRSNKKDFRFRLSEFLKNSADLPRKKPFEIFWKIDSHENSHKFYIGWKGSHGFWMTRARFPWNRKTLWAIDKPEVFFTKNPSFCILECSILFFLNEYLTEIIFIETRQERDNQQNFSHLARLIDFRDQMKEPF